MRTKAREVAFQTVFASRFSDNLDPNLKFALCKKEKLTGDDIAYVDRVLEIISEHSDEFSAYIDERSLAFPESRLFPADKSVLFIALAEIKYMDDIPAPVSVNEAANIAAKYSTPKSASFVSGILSECAEG